MWALSMKLPSTTKRNNHNMYWPFRVFQPSFMFIYILGIAVMLSINVQAISLLQLQQQGSKSNPFPPPSTCFTTKSGLPVCRYALGGAARSTQPSSLPGEYMNHLLSTDKDDNKFTLGAPFYFYYNPHRYPAFVSGLRDALASCCTAQNETRGFSSRHDVFLASGGAEFSKNAMEQRLQDALQAGGETDYLDAFILEYICPSDTTRQSDDIDAVNVSWQLNDDVVGAIQQAQAWKQQGLIRYVGASTHSHRVGATLAQHAGIDCVMIRYNMAHQKAAQTISFPACIQHQKPVLAFTTTRWNALQKGHVEWNDKDNQPPTTGDCLSYALASSPPVEVVLHSARDEKELQNALIGFHANMSAEEMNKWATYGNLEWNDIDSFDEYPEEESSP